LKLTDRRPLLLKKKTCCYLNHMIDDIYSFISFLFILIFWLLSLASPFLFLFKLNSQRLIFIFCNDNQRHNLFFKLSSISNHFAFLINTIILIQFFKSITTSRFTDWLDSSVFVCEKNNCWFSYTFFTKLFRF